MLPLEPDSGIRGTYAVARVARHGGDPDGDSSSADGDAAGYSDGTHGVGDDMDPRCHRPPLAPYDDRLVVPDGPWIRLRPIRRARGLTRRRTVRLAQLGDADGQPGCGGGGGPSEEEAQPPRGGGLPPRLFPPPPERGEVYRDTTPPSPTPHPIFCGDGRG